MTIQNVLRWVATLNKQKRFLLYLFAALVVASFVSVIVKFAFLYTPEDKVFRVAVVAPLSGADQEQGEAMVRGATLLAEQINQAGGIQGRQLKVESFDDGNDPQQAIKAAKSAAKLSDVLGVVGHWQSEAAARVIPYYAKQTLPALILASGPEGSLPDTPWAFRSLIDETTEVRFLANYVRNVIGEKTVFVLHESNERGAHLAATFDQVYQRFGTKILYQWPIGTDPDKMTDDLKAVVAEVESKKLFGTFLVLGDARNGARMVSALRAGGIKQRIVGMRQLATKGFQEQFLTQWKGTGSAASALNGLLVTTPMLFDMAGERAQQFRHGYASRFEGWPDWVSAYAYEGAKLLVTEAALALRQDPRLTLDDLHQQVRDRIAQHDSAEKGFAGVNGPLFFNAKGGATRLSMAGLYDGSNLVSALTQLSPIREEGVTNLLAEVTSGRALYVNDRFMYKTNVVYTGVRLEKISALDRSANTAEINFVIWFRWRGEFEPQDVVFTNAVAPIPLERPMREGKDGDMLYRAYRLKGKFYLGYSDAERSYGTLLAGLSFQHRQLGSHNLLYVSDLLGMNLLTPHANAANRSDGGGELLKKITSFFGLGRARLDPLVESWQEGQILAGISGWLIERGWISQEVIARSVDGNPLFVGFGKPQPLFSMLDVGMILKPDRFNARDLIASNAGFVYLAIFALVGTGLAILLDGKDRGQFWRIQTLFLRLISWPLLLIALGNLSSHYGLQYLTTATVDFIVLLFDILWWLVPAHLVTISLERFLWVPLENRTQRKIPNGLRRTVTLVVYVFALFGVVAFVMDKTITSLLATSGMLAMIMGMAVQSNLRDIVSGIVLNIERPFTIGDAIKINTISGIVSDIGWRTIRITASDGQVITFPNSKTSEAEIQNFSRSRCINVGLNLYTDPRHDPEQVLAIIGECLPLVERFVREIPDDGPFAHFMGVVSVDGHWVAHYAVSFAVNRLKRKGAIQELWQLLWPRFRAAGIEWRDLPEAAVPISALSKERKPA
ncbi:MAG: ABC transporter substrate-binding protein [Magnetococcales bacterium]|nr:ABC transporter substrate-binding protein [Magnetococcales bacterium]